MAEVDKVGQTPANAENAPGGYHIPPGESPTSSVPHRAEAVIRMDIPTQKDVAALPQHAMEYMAVLSTASNAISTTATTAAFAMGSFALALTIMAVLGWFSIKRMIRDRADSVLRAHIAGEQFRNMLETVVSNAVNLRVTGAFFVVPQQATQGAGGGIAPSPPQQTGGQT